MHFFYSPPATTHFKQRKELPSRGELVEGASSLAKFSPRNAQ